ncbi:hypothetical protein DL769_002741 [Monosporascus sp. CRB-8-3]|nr:hypothetical protein DL769_002741 [Monosporascus sp. CRB-8-3]
MMELLELGTQKKFKKGTKGNKGETKQKPAAVRKDISDDIPLKSYRVIESGDENIMTDYVMGAYALVKELADLRSYIREQWREVAYNKSNSATASALSRMTVAMVRRFAAAIFIDFPDLHDTYNTAINTVTRGDPETIQLSSVFSSFMHGSAYVGGAVADRGDVDVKEQFPIYTYQDLLDFIRDFQETRSGKPTKAMLKGLKKWNLNAKL